MRKITQAEYDSITTNASLANELLNTKKWEPLRQYLQNATDSVEAKILNNTIREVDEYITISQSLIRVFKTPKKVQIDEMTGAYQWIKKFLADLQQFIKIEKDLQDQIAKGRVKIDG